MTPKDILNKHTCNGQISTNFVIIQAMEEYAAQQAQEVKEERNKAVELLLKCNRIYLPKTLQGQVNEYLFNSLKQLP